MKKAKTNRYPRRTVSVAVMTIAAMLIVPLCGPFCSGSKNCPFAAAISGPQADRCHHKAASTETDGLQILSAARACNSFELTAAIVSLRQNSEEFRQAWTSTLQLHSTVATEYFLASPETRYARWDPGRDTSATNDAGNDTFVLRI